MRRDPLPCEATVYALLKDVSVRDKTCAIIFDAERTPRQASIEDVDLDQPFNDYTEADRVCHPIHVLLSGPPAAEGPLRIVGTPLKPWDTPTEPTVFDAEFHAPVKAKKPRRAPAPKAGSLFPETEAC